MHSLGYDAIHDEIVVPQPFAQAILTFRGGANGEEPPIRVIQGPKTQLANYFDQLVLDPVHNEIITMAGYPWADHIKIFSREANGNVAPIRELRGPEGTVLGFTPSKGPSRLISSVTVDPEHNLLIAAGSEGIMIFDRTAEGNAKPLRVIKGPKTGRAGGRLFVYPAKGEIIMIGGGGAPPELPRGTAGSVSTEMANNERAAYISVWNIEDKGDVAPRRWRVGGPTQRMPNDPDPGDYGTIMGAGVDPKNKSLMISSKTYNAVFTYSFPEIF